MHHITYEQPLNERVRTFLRLEHLFLQARAYLTHKNNEWIHRATLASLIEMLNIFDRADLKTEFLKEIDKFSLHLSKLKETPHVDGSRLQSILEGLELQANELQQMVGRAGQVLRDNELITVVRQRLSVPGGTCNFDLPVYHHWLNQPEQLQTKALQEWITALEPIEKTVHLLLVLIRDSGYTAPCTAQGGFFQKPLETHVPCQLIRVTLSQTEVFPEISGSKHRISVRFLESDHQNRPLQTNHDIIFSLTCCVL